MQKQRIKDQKLRNLFKKLEKKRIVNNFIKINLFEKINLKVKQNKLLFKKYNKQLYLQFLSRKKIRLKNKLIRRCVFTNRNRGTLQNFKISRVLLRELMGFGIIPGYKKGV